MSSDADAEADAETDGGGYVHRPADADPPTPTPDDAAADARTDADGDADAFGRAGWVLVAAVVFSVLIAPGVIYLYPGAPGGMGLSFLAAMLALPFLPALVLGLTAVWSMTAATGTDAETE